MGTFKIIICFIFFVLKAGAQGDWVRLDGVKEGDYILVVLEETELAKKANFGTWLPMVLYKASRNGPVEWQLSTCIHENSKMRISVSIKYANSIDGLKSVQYEWFNYGGSKIDISKDLMRVGSYNIPQYISKEVPMGTRILSIIHEPSLEMLKEKTSISKAAVFWDWSNLEITKL